MFNQVLENFREATAATMQLQQDMVKKWISLLPGLPSSPTAWAEKGQQVQKKWTETFADLLKKQREMTETHFKAGLQNIEKAFKVAEAKTPEELRTKSLELWQQCFENLRQVYETQVRGFEAATEKWQELFTKSAT
jgi:hypothetical protein